MTKDDMAKCLIISLLPFDLLTDIGLKYTSKEMWDSLLETTNINLENECKNPPASPCSIVSDDEYIIVSE